jgi:pimeloyl-ACP methyl ester carboxylesterase
LPVLTNEGASVSYTDTGPPAGRADAPTVVFGHGLLFSGWMFAAQIEALRADYRCVAVDWRGQGASPPAEGGYDMDTLSRDAVALIEHLGTAPVHYVGLSMGGFVGQRIAARRPELLRSLTLLDTSPDREERSAAIQDIVLSYIYRIAGIAPVRRPVEKIMLGPTFRADPRSKAIVDEWIAMLSRCERNGMQQAILAVARRKGVADEIGSIKAPTLVLVGADDVPTPVKKARRIAELVPGAQLEIIANAGHSSTIEQPEAITQLLAGFLAEVDGAEQ